MKVPVRVLVVTTLHTAYTVILRGSRALSRVIHNRLCDLSGVGDLVPWSFPREQSLLQGLGTRLIGTRLIHSKTSSTVTFSESAGGSGAALGEDGTIRAATTASAVM